MIVRYLSLRSHHKKLFKTISTKSLIDAIPTAQSLPKSNQVKTISFLLCSYILLRNTTTIKNDSQETKSNDTKETIPEQKEKYIIATNFMNKLSKKAYLNHENDTNKLLSHHYPFHYYWNNKNSIYKSKPEGIPKSLRLLIIDIDEFGYKPIPCSNVDGDSIDIFDKPCKLQSNYIYIDGIARSKRILKSKVEQKGLITSYAKAGEGVDILYASIKKLNPLGMKKHKEKKDYVEEVPWNQDAWYDELKIRLNGRIQFASPLERSSFLSHLFFGTIYKRTIPYEGNIITRLLFASPGIDGENNNPASNKPHAVIANGHAMSLVPGSLYLLSKYCKEANIPLYILHDPRHIWAKRKSESLDNHDLYAIVTEMKRNVKDRIIYNVFKLKQRQLEYSNRRFFEFGRKLGFLEAKVAMHWKSIKEPKSKVDDIEKTVSWKDYTAKELLNEFISRGLVIVNQNGDKGDESISNNYTCTKSLQEIYKLCNKSSANGSDSASTNIEEMKQK